MFWSRVERKIAEASKGNHQILVILSHDMRDYDVNNFSKIIAKIRDEATKVKVKVRFVLMSDIARGWKSK